MIWLILVYLIVNPLFFIHGQDLRTAQELCYQMSSVIVILAGLFFDNKPVKKSELNLWIGIAGIWSLFTMLFHNMGWSIMFNIILGIGVYFTVVRCISKEDIPKALKAVTWLSTFALIYLMFQYFGFRKISVKYSYFI